jgi:DNA-binding transcriptional LysR family regulator
MQLNKIDLNKLNTFLAVVENQGVSKAADRLLLTRSAVSQSITSLEQSLGIQLFSRVGKKMILTESGSQLFESFRQYHHQLRKVVSMLGNSLKEPSGTVRLGFYIGFSKDEFTELVSDFLNEYSQVNIKFFFSSQLELSSLILENKLDFALSLYPLSEDHTSIHSVRLYSEELILVTSRKYYSEKPTWEDLQKMPVIDYYQNGQLFKAWIRHHFNKELTDVRVRAYAATIDFVLELVQKEIGVGIVPRHIAAPLLAKKVLYQLKTGQVELSDYIWLNSSKSVHHDSAARTFFTRLKQHYEPSHLRRKQERQT